MHGDHLAERKDHGTVHAGPGHGASRSAPLCRRACRWLPPAVTKRLASCGSHAPAHSCGSSPADSAAAICAAPLLVCIPWIPALQGCKAGPSVPTSLHLVLTETGQDWLPDPTSYKALAGTSMSALPARRAAAHDLRDERRRVVGVTGPGEPLRRLTCAPPSPRRQVRRWPSSRLASASGAAACHAVARTAPAWPLSSAARCAGPSGRQPPQRRAVRAAWARGRRRTVCALFLLFCLSILWQCRSRRHV